MALDVPDFLEDRAHIPSAHRDLSQPVNTEICFVHNSFSTSGRLGRASTFSCWCTSVDLDAVAED